MVTLTAHHPAVLRCSLRCLLTYGSTLRRLLARALLDGRCTVNPTMFDAESR
jgi:hypothetical protein